MRCQATPFVEVTVEISLDDWDYWFFTDRIHQYPGEKQPVTVYPRTAIRKCVVGFDTWSLQSINYNWSTTWWFTGSNVVQRTTTDTNSEPAAGAVSTHADASTDGNPGRPGGVADLIGFDTPGRVAWLALCSAPCLKHEGRKIFPPDSFWKESAIYFYGWTDQSKVFDDSLGLPQSVTLTTTNNQPIFQYQVRRSTNVLGWNFPLEFYGIQYIGSVSNGWRAAFSFKGKVTDIHSVSSLEMPKLAK